MVPGSESQFGAFDESAEQARIREVEAQGGDVSVPHREEDDGRPAGLDEELRILHDRTPLLEGARPELPDSVEQTIRQTEATLNGDQVEDDDEGTREADPNGHAPLNPETVARYEREDAEQEAFERAGRNSADVSGLYRGSLTPEGNLIVSAADAAAIRKMREAPDGAEGELSDGPGTWERAETPDSGFPSLDLDDLTEEESRSLSQMMAALLGLDPDTPPLTQSDADFLEGSELVVGTGINPVDRVPWVVVAISVDIDGRPTRALRKLSPLKAIQAAQAMLQAAVGMIEERDPGEDDADEPAATPDPDPQSPEKLDTDE